MIENIHLSLEEAVAVTPSRPPSPTFIASTAAIAWGAVRSGQSIWEYVIGMTHEFEAKLQAEYDAWKAENAWYRNQPMIFATVPDAATITPVSAEDMDMPTSVQAALTSVSPENVEISAAVTVQSNVVEVPDIAPHGTKPVLATADEVEASAPAATKPSPTPAVALEAPSAPTISSLASTPPSAVKRRSPRAKTSKKEKTAAQKPSVKDMETAVEGAKVAVEGITNLPAVPDDAIYNSILAGRDRDELINALETFISKQKRIHRPRSAQIAFLKWLNETAFSAPTLQTDPDIDAKLTSKQA